MRKILILPFLGLIYIYKYLISPLLPRACRHYPSCSTYAVEALKMHGLFRGILLAANRISRCQPWGTSGYDPVPLVIVKKVHLKGNRLLHTKKYPTCNILKQH